MMLLDVNVLIYAYNDGSPDHHRWSCWLAEVLEGHESFGITSHVFASFIRIVMDERLFTHPSRFYGAYEFIEILKSDDKFVLVQEGSRHWNVFTSLCRILRIKSQQIPDTYLAAIAIEQGHELITADKGFKKYPGLKFRNPLERR